MTKECIACGMLMEKTEDFALADESKDFCKHCVKEDGSMRSYEETLESFTQFMMKSEGLEEGEAREKVKKIMGELPAWKGQCDCGCS